MCFHFTVKAKAQEVKDFLGKSWSNDNFTIIDEDFNGFTHPQTPVVTTENSEQIQMMSWGLIPSWAKDDEIRKHTLNARIETLDEKPSFKDNISNRCLIVATSFYEWQWRNKSGSNKKKFKINVADQPLFCFAGIYDDWTHPTTGQKQLGYSIVTTQANAVMAAIHNTKQRMPIILHREDHEKWLETKQDFKSFAFPYESQLEAVPADGSLELF